MTNETLYQAPSSVRFVLVRPTHPGNIGAAARAIKTMGFERLVLVAPQARPDHPEARARASGASDVLAKAEVYPTLSEAIASATLAVALTSRSREYANAFLPLPEASRRVVDHWRAHPNAAQVDWVFGTERTGLTNEEVWQCSLAAFIPANPAYPSLNLAAAVQIVAYQLALSWPQQVSHQPAVSVPEPDALPCTEGQIDGVVRHWLQLAEAVGFYDPRVPKRLEARLRRLLHRARLERAEANILRGMAKAVLQRLGSQPS